jgi:sugar transferase (PEP-CTERM/EpsH1 system associated)
MRVAADQVPLIAHVIDRLDVGGLENGLVNLINHIPRDRYRHAIVCLKNYTDYRERLKRDVKIFSLNKRPGKDLRLYWQLWRLFRDLQPDLVHTRNLSTLEAQLPAFLAGVPSRIHGEHGRDMHDLDNTSARYRYLRMAFRPLVNGYVALSLDLMRYLERGVGVPTTKLTHLYNGVNTESFRPRLGVRSDLVSRDFCPSGAAVIGTVGRMEAVKDQLTLAQAFANLISRRSSTKGCLRLVMIGDGVLRPQVIELLSQAGLADISWLPGARDDIPDLLRSMDIFVLPSLAEGISNTILEAMATGLPVIATDVGGNPELVVDGVTGYLVPRSDPDAMTDAMARYLENPELMLHHGQAGRERVMRHFSIQQMVTRYIELYDELLETKGKKRFPLPAPSK